MKDKTKLKSRDFIPLIGYSHYNARMMASPMTEEYNSEINKKIRRNLEKLEIYNLTTIGFSALVTGTLIAKII